MIYIIVSSTSGTAQQGCVMNHLQDAANLLLEVRYADETDSSIRFKLGWLLGKIRRGRVTIEQLNISEAEYMRLKHRDDVLFARDMLWAERETQKKFSHRLSYFTPTLLVDWITTGRVTREEIGMEDEEWKRIQQMLSKR